VNSPEFQQRLQKAQEQMKRAAEEMERAARRMQEDHPEAPGAGK
jgi:molecular chaperone GrpE (heat shock protein)